MKDKKKKKVLLLGWDAADWKVINPLMDQGLMPNMKRLVENGTIANLATLDPPFSPMLWSSIATGKRPYKHGVHGFTEVTPNGKGVRPVMSISRKCKAIWNILTQKKYKTHVVGWWPSHPAEPINGVMISNFFQKEVGAINEPWPLPKGTVHPADDADHFAQFRVHFQELTGEHILPFVSEAAKIDQKKDRRIRGIAKLTSHAASLHAAFTNIIREREWDFAALYLDAIDHYCHGFMKYHPPKRPHIPQEDYDYYSQVVTAGYRYHDMILGRIMSLIDDQTTLMLISDHGFQPDHLRPRNIPKVPAGPAYEHSDYGVLAVMGPGIKKDHITYGVNLLDICPTILALLGLEIGEDMDGRVINGIFNEMPDLKFIPSWEEVEGEDGMLESFEEAEDEDANEAAIKQLEDLGYIEKQRGTKEQKIQKTKDNSNYNLARAYIDGGKYFEAIPILEDLFKRNGEMAVYGFRLATCLQAVGKLTEARSLIAQLRALEKYEDSVLDIMEGSLLIGERKPLDALKILKKAEGQITNHHSRVNLQIAKAYMMLSRWGDAERALKKEIEVDYDTPIAHSLLGRLYLLQKYYEKSANSYLNALGMTFNDPSLHQGLGLALFNMGKYQDAANALENSLAMAPNNTKSREIIIKIYKNHLTDETNYRKHQAILDAEEKKLIYVVSGLPRSGTSMMMQMLEKGGLELFTDGIREKDENNPRGYKEHESVKTLPRNKKWLHKAEGKVIKVIAQLLPHLSSKFEYRIIFMERDLIEIIASQRKMLNRLGKRKEEDVYPLGIKQTYEQQLRKVKNWVSKRDNIKMLTINHRDTINDPVTSALKVNEFLDNRLAPERMVQAVDTSLYREKTF